MVIDRKAQKGVKDPVQQKLRDEKKQWSKDTSVLIAQLIAFKRGLNGRGDPRAGLPPSNIKDPLPQEIERYLQQMIGRFQDIANRADAIVDHQEEYSSKRRKSNSETNMPIAASAGSSLEKQARIFDKSHGRSRLWAYITQYPWFSKDKGIEKKRLKLLYSLADFERQINEIEYVLTSFDEHANVKAFYDFSRFLLSFEKMFMNNFTEALDLQKAYLLENKDNLEPPPAPSSDKSNELRDQHNKDNSDEQQAVESNRQEAERQGGLPDKTPNNPDKSSTDEWGNMATMVKTISNDLVNSMRFFSLLESEQSKGIVHNFSSVESLEIDIRDLQNKAKDVLSKVKKKDPTGLSKLYDGFLNEYNMFIKGISEGIGHKVDSLEGAVDILSKKQAAFNAIIYKTASSHKLNRWLQRVRLSIYTDQFERARYEAAILLRDTSDLMDDAESMLENKSSLITVIPFIKEIYIKLGKLCEYFVYFGTYHSYTYNRLRGSGDKPGMGDIYSNTMKRMQMFKVKLEANSTALDEIMENDKSNG